MKRIHEFVARQCENWEKYHISFVETASQRQRRADRNLRPSTFVAGVGCGNRLVAGAFALGKRFGHP